MQILYWNTCLSTNPKALFEALMFLNEALKGIDYFCINEATEALSDLFKEAQWNVFYMPNTTYRGVLIASKQTLRHQRSYLLSERKHRKRNIKNYLLMVEASHRKQPITIATTHLTFFRLHELGRRRLERQRLIQYLPRNRTIFGGDLNSAVLPLAKWAVTNLGYHSRVRGKTWCWHLKNTWYRIPFKLQLDYVLSTHDIDGSVSAWILAEQKLSDHFPILAELH